MRVFFYPGRIDKTPYFISAEWTIFVNGLANYMQIVCSLFSFVVTAFRCFCGSLPDQCETMRHTSKKRHRH